MPRADIGLWTTDYYYLLHYGATRGNKMNKKFHHPLHAELTLHRRRVCSVAVSILFLLAMATSASPWTTAKSEPTGESRFTTLDGVRLHYVNYNRDSGERGKGKAKAGNDEEALVLIHGWTMNAEHWRDQVPAFMSRNRVIAIDLPGHGQSDKPQVAYSMEYFARAVDAVMRHAKVKRAVLVGHSMGTPIARQFYRKYPEKTLAIVIVDGALKPFGDKAMMDRMIASLRTPDYMQGMNQMFTMMMGTGLPSETQERIKGSTLKTPQHVVVSAMEGMADPSIWGDDKINVPVLAIMAKNPFFPPNLEELYRTLVPKLDYYMWDSVGHFLMMEKPKEFNEVVLAFLEKNKLLM
jgi:pimeloyl-ACP methyl ester carboxylesterase